MPKRDPKTSVTKEILDQAVDAILKGVERMFDKQNKRIDRRFSRLETDVREIHRRIIDLEIDSPTRKEFDSLKSRVDKYHPL